jgi:arylsulfatase A-like enzyme
MIFARLHAQLKGTAGCRQPAKRSKTLLRRPHLQLEVLEDRRVPTASAQHVLLLSVDGLHGTDVTDPNLKSSIPNIVALEQNGVSYSNATTTSPSDSFPGTLSYLTGAGPGTTGVFYDDSYSRTLFAPGSNKPGTEVTYFEAIDKNLNLISGGGNFDASSIDPTTLPVNSQGQPVYPNQFLQVNTIFDVAHQAGLYTAFSDKHPAYQIANGNDPNAINDFYGPEINSTTALLYNSTGHTVDANALLAVNPFVDLSKYTLVDPSTDPDNVDAHGNHQLFPDSNGNFIDPNLITDTTHNTLLTMKYDELKVQAILKEIAGKASHAGIANPQVPAIFGMNFQAVSVAEKYYLGGINMLPNGQEGAPSKVLQAALQHTDASIGEIVAALKSAGLWNSTELYVTAKHGQDPRVGFAGIMMDSTLPNLLASVAPVAQATQDNVSLLWLQDQSTTQAGVQALQNFKNTGTLDVFFQGVKQTVPASQVIDEILSGQGLVNAGLGDPAKNSTTPDIIVTLKPAYIWVGNPTHYQFKRAEHGGFTEDSTHIALIVAGGSVPGDLRGQTIDTPVKTTQIAVSVLDALGLNPNKLQGVKIEHTKALPDGMGNDAPEGSGEHKPYAPARFAGENFNLASQASTNGQGVASSTLVTGSTTSGTTGNDAHDDSSLPTHTASGASAVTGGGHVPGTGRAVKTTECDILDDAIAGFLQN